MSSRGNYRRSHNRGRFSNSSRKFPASNSSYNKHDKYKQFVSQERLSESEVGITEYLSDLSGFSGIIKARYSDFHVNEINKSGEIAKLTDVSVPSDFEAVINEDPVESTADLIKSETWDKLKELVNSTETAENTVEVDVTAFSKEDRTRIHEAVKNVFGQKIVAGTKLVDDKKFIEFKKFTKNVDNRYMGFKWPKDKGEYVHFIVYKEVMDTLEATFKISDCLRMKSSSFTYAGVKDRRAKTTQWFCVKKLDPRKLINRTKCFRNIHIGNLTFKDEPLKLGQLNGNRFRIALRNVTADDSLINDSMESLKTNGFINYYGLQRFGNDKEVPTFEIGVKLLLGQWKEACNLILKPKSSDDPNFDVSQAKRVYQETSNCKMANSMFNRSHNKCVESKLLVGLCKNHDNDYVNALENIPRNMRLLYIHAFQSLTWNKIVSRRIKEFGCKPIVGDIVLLSEESEEIAEEATTTDETEETNDVAIKRQEVKILTEEDLSNYSIYDIVLPLPGYDIKYPENQVKVWYEEVLKEHGLTLEMPKQKVKTYTLSGTYRKILGQVTDFSWKTMKYDHPNDTLIRSDYEELMGQEEPKDNPEGQYKALILDFCISSSCYATMVLREVLKTDTSCSAHAKLNKYHVDDETMTEVEELKSKENKEKVPIAETDSLLSNAAKYEEFKQQIFGFCGDAEKRKSSDSEESASKKIKSIDENEETGIKIQPALV